MLNSTEKIERTLYTIGNNFQLKNTLLINASNSEKRKLAPVYSKSYESAKYSNVSSLNTIGIRYSSFIVFSFMTNDDGKFRSEEIYLSFPHLTYIKNFLLDCAETITQNDVFQNGKLNPNYSDLTMVSEELSSQKKIAIYPSIIERDEVTLNGVGIVINDDNNTIETDIATFLTLVEIINDITPSTLISMSADTFTMGMLYDSLNGSSKGSSTNSSNNTTANRNIFGNRTGSSLKNRPSSRPTLSRNTNETNDESNDEEDRPSLAKRTIRSRTVNKTDLDNIIDDDNDETSSSPLSMNDIMNEAENVDVGDLSSEVSDDDIKFD